MQCIRTEGKAVAKQRIRPPQQTLLHFAAVVVAAAAASTAAATAAAATAALQHLRSCLGLRTSQRSLNSLHSGTVDAAAVAAAAAAAATAGFDSNVRWAAAG